MDKFKLPERGYQRFHSEREFELREKLGEGGFSQVYEAFHRNTGRSFALKIVDFSKLGVLDQENIQREIELHKRFHHRHIVQLIDFFQEGKKVFLVLELCTNGNLFQRLRKQMFLSLEEIQIFFKQSCLAVKYLHDQNLVMRDIKPENLLLDAKMNIKLCDFGWTASLTESDEYLKLQSGTFAFMSPESLLGAIQRKESDIWGLGILLYELISGKEPYHGTSCQEQLEFIRYKSLHFSFKKFSPESISLIKSCLNFEAKKRPSIEEVLASEFLNKNDIDDPRKKYPYNPFEGDPLLEGLVWEEGELKDPLMEDLVSNPLKKTYQEVEEIKDVSVNNVREKYGINLSRKNSNYRINPQNPSNYSFPPSNVSLNKSTGIQP